MNAVIAHFSFDYLFLGGYLCVDHVKSRLIGKNEKDVPHPVDALNAMGAQTFIDSFCSTAS